MRQHNNKFIAVGSPISNGALLACLLYSANSLALDVNISNDIESVETAHEGRVVTIQRNQDQSNVLTGGFTKTSRKCPPFCIQPINVAEGVSTVGELELVQFIENQLNTGKGVLIDARTPSWHQKGTIPGSVNIPFTTFDKEKDPLVLSMAMGKLGVKRNTSPNVITSIWNNVQKILGNKNNMIATKWNFDNAKTLMLWCNGMWCGQSPRAIRGLLKIGYPAEKIHYYRGGMQSWQALGLTVIKPTNGN